MSDLDELCGQANRYIEDYRNMLRKNERELEKYETSRPNEPSASDHRGGVSHKYGIRVVKESDYNKDSLESLIDNCANVRRKLELNYPNSYNLANSLIDELDTIIDTLEKMKKKV